MITMNGTDKVALSGDGAVTNCDAGSATRPQKGNDAENSVVADNDSGLLGEGQPFHTTLLGKLPPEIREKIFINLLALPPPFARRNIAKEDAGTSHEFATNGHDDTSNTPCYHLKRFMIKKTPDRCSRPW